MLPRLRVLIVLSSVGLARAASAQVTLEPAQVSLQAYVHNATWATVLLTNPGGASINVESIEISGDGRERFGVQTAGPFVLGSKASRALTVTFVPSARGEVGALLTVKVAGQPLAQAALTGRAAVAILQWATERGTTDVDFGDVALGSQSQLETVGLKVPSSGISVIITSIVSSDPAFVVDWSGTSIFLSPSSQTVFTMEFVPQRPGPTAASVTIHVGQEDGPTLSIPVRGNGTGFGPGRWLPDMTARPERSRGSADAGPWPPPPVPQPQPVGRGCQCSTRGHGRDGGAVVVLVTVFHVRCRRRSRAQRAKDVKD